MIIIHNSYCYYYSHNFSYYVFLSLDAPYLAPRREIKRNEPKYLGEVVTKIATLLGLSEEEVARQTTENTNRLFGI